MEWTRENLLDRVLDHYSVYYDVARCDASDAPLMARAAFHEHGTGYALIRKAEMWSADRHEYAFFFSVPHLTREIYETCLAQTRTLGEPLVDPVSGHMSTFLVAIFLCESVDSDAVKALKTCRIRKSFQFSLKGWMEVHTAAVDLGKDTVVGNAAGRNTVKFLKSLLHPKVRHITRRK